MQWKAERTSNTNICCQVLLVGIMMAAVAGAAPPSAAYDRSNALGNQLLLRAAAADLDRLVAQYDLTLLDKSGDGELPLLVAGPQALPADQLAGLLAQDRAVSGVEPVILAALPGIDNNAAPHVHLGDIVPDLLQTGYYTGSCWSRNAAEPWSGYSTQGTGSIIRLLEAHQARNGCGRGITVAVLDTGIDPSHPLLADALVPGYDFVFGEAGMPSEYRLVPDQSQTTIVEQSQTTIVEADRVAILAGRGEATDLGNGIAPILAASSIDTLEGLSLPPFFGHGTMVAGLVRWTAPRASIMPIRVFDGNGKGHVYDIIRAIYWAVDHGADIINLSFTLSDRSQELHEALRYASEHGVVSIAAAGNQGERTLAYPAAYSGAVGVGATTLDDDLAGFSNYGSQLADLAAPGAGVISTYPGNHYAAGWGTSFAAPLVAGTLALVYKSVRGTDQAASQKRVHLLTAGSQSLQDLAGDIGRGRLDVLGTVLVSE